MSANQFPAQFPRAGVDADKIEATFKNGVLSVTLPKSAETRKAQNQIAVKGVSV